MAVSDFGGRKKIISSLTLPVQFSPPHAGKGQIPHSPGTDDSQKARGLKIGSFKFPPRRAKMVFKYPTLSSDSSVCPQLSKTFFVSQSLTNAISLPLNYFLYRPNTCFMAVSDGVRKKSHLKPDSSGSIFPTPRRQRSNSPLPGHRR